MSDENVFQLPGPRGTYLCSVEFWRQPDGKIIGALSDMPAHVIEAVADTPSARLRLIANWMESGAPLMREHASRIEITKEQPDE